MASVTELWTYRNLIANLAERDLKAQHKRSLLGALWSLINPASTLLIYTLVFGTFLRIEPPVAGNGELEAFALYLFCALIMWNFFNMVVRGSMEALAAAGPLLRKVYFPPECAPIANAMAVLTQTVLESGILLLVMLVLSNVSWTFLLFPVLVVLLICFCLGLGLMLSVANVYYRDVTHLTGVAMNFLFYATPIIYPLRIVPEHAWGLPARDLVSLNPLTQFTEGARDLLYLHQVPSLTRWVGLITTSVLILLLGRWVFNRASANLSEEL